MNDICGAAIPHERLRALACLRRPGHTGSHIARMRDADVADCSHGNGPASRCSQCLGAPVQRVTTIGSAVQVDGVTARPVEPVRKPFGRDFKRRRRVRT